MDTQLSSYWVKFFKNAGFPTDLATKHAITFTNNRIKPDMLPDLDKSSLKDMGITLMGDMIAILRYAKKVVEETSCKTFMVKHTEDVPVVKAVAKPVVKKVVPKTATKISMVAKNKSGEGLTKTVKTVSNTIAKPSVTLKKKVAPVAKTSKLYSDYIETKTKPKALPVKRKYEISSDEDDEMWALKAAEKRRKSSDGDVDCQIVLPKRNPTLVKKTIEQKKTVFHRLGDSMVSSTTSIAESTNSSFSPTFTVTGVTISKDSQKRNSGSSVFNRLGNKDSEAREGLYSRSSRNGVSSGTQGILKTRPSMFGTTALTTKPPLKKSVGTMRADEEAVKKVSSVGVKQLVRTTKSMKIAEAPGRLTVKVPVHGKLASESVILPAKSRLGMSKQVTFNRTTTVSHFQKPGVFSRLGV